MDPVEREIAARRRRLDHARAILHRVNSPDGSAQITGLQRLEAAQTLIVDGDLPTFAPLLPLCFNLDGRPYTLDDYMPTEAFFGRYLASVTTVKGSRQISKSSFLAARTLTLALAIPYFKILFVFPLYEQVSRFSTQYVRKLIMESPIAAAFSGQGTEKSVLTRSFTNFSKMSFSFASLSVERARGLSVNLLGIDEIQNLDPRFLPILLETMSASRVQDNKTGKSHRVSFRYNTGTPLSMDNILERSWQRSSMAEWVVPCLACKKANYPAKGMDLEKMIGGYHDDIGEIRDGKKPATICANSKCGRPVDPRNGFWHHRHPKLIESRPGYHIPQIIMPMHYAERLSWAKLLAKQSGADNYTTSRFYNEVLGESYDAGSRLVSETDLRNAAILPWENNPKDPRAVLQAIGSRRKYICRFMGVDWGGGGEEEISFTTIAVLGLLPDGKIDVLYGRRLLITNNPGMEADVVCQVFRLFNCDALCHDYNGAGHLRENYAVASGIPFGKVIPFVYGSSAAKDIVVHHAAEEEHHRSYYRLDKARAIATVCEAIKVQYIRFFKFDQVDDDNRGLLMDFTSLIEVIIETARAGTTYAIHRKAAFSDDFVHSVVFAACGIWQARRRWPNFAAIAKLRMSQDQVNAVNPENPWRDEANEQS